MKKALLFLGLVIGLTAGLNNSVYAENVDLPKIQAISEIGTLAVNDNYMTALGKCNEALLKYPDEPDLYYWRASIKSSMGEKKAALEDYNKAVELAPNDSDMVLMRGICKMDLGDRDGALADFNKAIEMNPKDSTAYSMRACLKIEKGDFQGANDDLEISNKLFEESEKQEKPNAHQ